MTALKLSYSRQLLPVLEDLECTQPGYGKVCLATFEGIAQRCLILLKNQFHMRTCAIRPSADYKNDFIEYYIRHVTSSTENMFAEIETRIIEQLTKLPTFQENLFTRYVSIRIEENILVIGYHIQLLIKPPPRRILDRKKSGNTCLPNIFCIGMFLVLTLFFGTIAFVFQCLATQDNNETSFLCSQFLRNYKNGSAPDTFTPTENGQKPMMRH